MAQKGVIVQGDRLGQVNVSDADKAQLVSGKVEMADNWMYKAVTGNWMGCPVPKLLGVPLAIKIIDRSRRSSDERIAVFMLADEKTGLAPMDFQRNGVGVVVMARTDGQDLTETNIRELNNYLHSLMDLWPELDLTQPRDRAQLQKALSVEEYNKFTSRYPS